MNSSAWNAIDTDLALKRREGGFLRSDTTVRVTGWGSFICDACGTDRVFPDQIRCNEQGIASTKLHAKTRTVG